MRPAMAAGGPNLLAPSSLARSPRGKKRPPACAHVRRLLRRAGAVLTPRVHLRSRVLRRARAHAPLVHRRQRCHLLRDKLRHGSMIYRLGAHAYNAFLDIGKDHDYKTLDNWRENYYTRKFNWREWENYYPGKFHCWEEKDDLDDFIDLYVRCSVKWLREPVLANCIAKPPTQLAAIPELPDDILAHIGKQAYNPLEPRTTVYISSASHGLRKLLTLELRQRLQEEHEAAAAFCLKMGASCKALREATDIEWRNKGLSVADLTTLGTLGSVLPALEKLELDELDELDELEHSASPDGVQQLAEKLGAGALPGLTMLSLCMPVGDAGALALAAALGRGALPRLRMLYLVDADIGDAGLAALATALRRRPALGHLHLTFNPLGDEGLAALVAPPPLAGALPPPAGGLKNLTLLGLGHTQITDAGCAALVEALDSGALPALVALDLDETPASAESKEALQAALARSRAAFQSYSQLEEARRRRLS